MYVSIHTYIYIYIPRLILGRIIPELSTSSFKQTNLTPIHGFPQQSSSYAKHVSRTASSHPQPSLAVRKMLIFGQPQPEDSPAQIRVSPRKMWFDHIAWRSASSLLIPQGTWFPHPNVTGLVSCPCWLFVYP